MPPEKIELSVHHASIMLSTLNMAMATQAPRMPTPKLERRTTASSSF